MLSPALLRSLLHPFALLPLSTDHQEPQLSQPVVSLQDVPSVARNEPHPERLRAARHHLGLTQQMLADFAQVSPSSIGRAERGEYLRSDTISLLCQYFSQRFQRPVLPHELGLACL